MQIQLNTTGMERPKMAQSIGHTYTLASRNFWLTVKGKINVHAYNTIVQRKH